MRRLLLYYRLGFLPHYYRHWVDIVRGPFGGTGGPVASVIRCLEQLNEARQGLAHVVATNVYQEMQRTLGALRRWWEDVRTESEDLGEAESPDNPSLSRTPGMDELAGQASHYPLPSFTLADLDDLDPGLPETDPGYPVYRLGASLGLYLTSVREGQGGGQELGSPEPPLPTFQPVLRAVGALPPVVVNAVPVLSELARRADDLGRLGARALLAAALSAAGESLAFQGYELDSDWLVMLARLPALDDGIQAGLASLEAGPGALPKRFNSFSLYRSIPAVPTSGPAPDWSRPAQTASGPPVPRWEHQTGRLYLGDVSVRHILRVKQAVRVVEVLDDFQQEGWPDWVKARRPVATTHVLYSLNKALRGMRFFSRGGGAYIGWSLTTESTSPPTS